jgi:hypothetical protein
MVPSVERVRYLYPGKCRTVMGAVSIPIPALNVVVSRIMHHASVIQMVNQIVLHATRGIRIN